MTLTRQDLEDTAVRLFEAERTRTQIPLLTDLHPDMDMDDAYAVQAAFVHRKIAAGDKVSGWKIGLTSRAMQTALQIDIPDSGVLLESMHFATGSVIPPDRFIQPRIEAEIAFVMKKPLSGADTTVEDVLAATAYIVPALEILDTRIVRKNPVSGRMRTVLDTISDNAANAGVVVGRPIHAFHSIDMRWMGAIVAKNGKVEETGLGAGVLNSPALSVAWLAQRLHRYGDRIDAGQIVLSGSFIRPVEAPPGSHISADFGPFGLVDCQF